MDSSYLVQAIAQCQQAVETKSTDPEKCHEAFAELGNLLQGMGQFDRAIVWHSLAMENDINTGEVYCQLGELYSLERDWRAALSCFENALEYLPNSAQIYFSMAQINGQLQQREAEMDCWYRATQFNPDLVNNNGYYKLGKALEQRGKIEEAIACYERAIEGEGKLSIAFYDLGELYQRQRKLDRAQAVYQQILEIEPTEARARYKLGTIYLLRHSFEPAIACFRQTIKDAPDFPWAYRDLVKTFLILGKWDEAISTCYAILNMVEEYPWVYSHLGNALREKGKHAEAAINFQKACAHRGWTECVEHGYFVTHDVFSHRIELWTEYLKPFATRPNVKILEVGFYQGMSACWLMDSILTDDTDRLTCIDKHYHPKFKENITKTGAESRVDILQGDVRELMSESAQSSFDVINLQDRDKTIDIVAKTTELAWKLLKPQGIIIFNYYGWRSPKDESQNPKVAIDRFLNSTKGQWQHVHLAPPISQLIIRKL